jgi:cyclohexanecarboxylate-CoA ligase
MELDPSLIHPQQGPDPSDSHVRHLIEPRIDAMVASGLWRNQTINSVMVDVLSSTPDKVAVVAYRLDDPIRREPLRLTYAELDERATLVAAHLQRLGVVHGEVVSFQLPNWWEFVVLALACAKIGAVANPLMPIFRQRELTFMLGLAESKVFVVPAAYRGFDYAAMAHEVVAALPSPPQVIVVGGADESSFDAVLLAPLDVKTAPQSFQPVQPNDLLLVMYTSGTTGEPKGVMHTSNTLLANVFGFVDRLDLHADDVVLGASPMAHLTGYGYLAMMPLVLGATTVLQDVWSGPTAMQIALDEGVTFSMASSPFIADMCDAAQAGSPTSPTFTKFCCAGAPIPPVLISRARTELGLTVCSAWGMTENGAVTITEPNEAARKSGVSDGKPVPGMEVKVIDADGAVVETGVTGSLLVRGASLFAGYLKRPELNSTDTDGWFDTGDLAYLDEEGYIRIDGRTKDLIIRGGENIPVVEIENVLYQHQAVGAVAIVGYPDERLGERACVFVVAKPGFEFGFDEMRAYLTEQQVARQYHPERIEIIDEMPRTPSGKIQKFKLRSLL